MGWREVLAGLGAGAQSLGQGMQRIETQRTEDTQQTFENEQEKARIQIEKDRTDIAALDAQTRADRAGWEKKLGAMTLEARTAFQSTDVALRASAQTLQLAMQENEIKTRMTIKLIGIKGDKERQRIGLEQQAAAVRERQLLQAAIDAQEATNQVDLELILQLGKTQASIKSDDPETAKKQAEENEAFVERKQAEYAKILGRAGKDPRDVIDAGQTGVDAEPKPDAAAMESKKAEALAQARKLAPAAAIQMLDELVANKHLSQADANEIKEDIRYKPLIGVPQVRGPQGSAQELINP